MTTAERILTMVKQELGLPDPIPRTMNITLALIQGALDDCKAHGLTDKQAEALIIKMWMNSKEVVSRGT